jgi:tetratricopeptide (TPR) repeat protein
MQLGANHKLKKLMMMIAFFVVQQSFGSGLPGENLLTQRWRDMIATHSPLTNPALLTEENYFSVRGALAPILNGEFLHSEIGFTLPIGLYQSFGYSLVYQFDGSVQGSSQLNSGALVLDNSSSKSNHSGYHLFTWSYHLWDHLSLGVNAAYAYQTNFGNTLFGIGFDLGATYRLVKHPVFGDHILGIATQNLIAPQMDSVFTVKFNGTNSYSRDLKFSWISNYWERRIESVLDFDIKDFFASAENFQANDGVSFANKLEWNINYKIGVWALRLFKLYMQAGFNENALDYWGIAVGLNAPSVNFGRDFEVLYQYTILTEDQNEATGHTISLRADIGRHREEMWARRMARMASLSPNELYNKARKLYSEEKYWDAFFVFSRIMVEFPDFFKNDWVEYYRSSCQEELDMREVSIKNYGSVKKNYPMSAAVPYSDLGLMRVYYRKHDFSNVTNQYLELSKPNVPDSLRFHGVYLMGQSYLQNNDPAKAIDLFGTIPDSHPDYIFAQHATAVAYAKMDHDMSVIVSSLENCIGTKAIQPDQKEMASRSYLLLGYIFYEENTLSKAVVALRMVPSTSYYYEDALLGQAWTALKARQWTDCISIGQMLSKASNKDAVKCEGMLIQAYGHLLQKDYVQSLNILKEATVKVRKISVPDQDSLNYARMQNESERMAYNFLAEKVEGISNAGQTATMISQTDSLRGQQISYVKKFNEFDKFADEFGRVSFFSRNVESIRQDIEYAEATVQKIVGQKGLMKEQGKIDDKQKSIDGEIEKLKKEMEKLQEKND